MVREREREREKEGRSEREKIIKKIVEGSSRIYEISHTF